jgi:hypothetical protein
MRPGLCVGGNQVAYSQMEARVSCLLILSATAAEALSSSIRVNDPSCIPHSDTLLPCVVSPIGRLPSLQPCAIYLCGVTATLCSSAHALPTTENSTYFLQRTLQLSSITHIAYLRVLVFIGIRYRLLQPRCSCMVASA